MKLFIAILALINGGWMLIDGIHVLLNGKYIGPEKPGPWANLFYQLNINVFKLGPVFILFGIIWLSFLFGLWTGQPWTYLLGIVISTLTLWYLPFGTLLAIITLIVLLIWRKDVGL